MCNPKSDLAPAKKRLLEIKLPQGIKDVLLDLAAKTMAELMKG
jgi:hypothetical protein